MYLQIHLHPSLRIYSQKEKKGTPQYKTDFLGNDE